MVLGIYLFDTMIINTYFKIDTPAPTSLIAVNNDSRYEVVKEVKSSKCKINHFAPA